MALDFADILEPSEIARPPGKVRKFLFREPAPSGSEQTRGFYAYGYARAFDQLAESALERWPGGGYMEMPIFFLCRHSIELHIKDAIDDYSRHSALDADLTGHNIARLWNQLLAHIVGAGFGKDDDWTRYCTKLVHHIHEVDPDGERFRYPSSVQGIAFEFTRVELEGLRKAHRHITSYCDAVGSMLADCEPGW